jgi:hypothetical protein
MSSQYSRVVKLQLECVRDVRVIFNDKKETFQICEMFLDAALVQRWTLAQKKTIRAR